ncbi:MAG: hypothetical protein ACYCT1_08215 [Steroidobacteraceae bacterium]
MSQAETEAAAGPAPAPPPASEPRPAPGAAPGSESPFALAAITDVDEARKHIQELQRFVGEVMVKGVDYGTIPGTQKPSLWKAGAEKLCELYGLTATPTIEDRIEDWQGGFFMYRVHVDLLNRRSGYVISHGVGSCNSMEGRYRYRWEWPSKLTDEEKAAATKTKSVRSKDGSWVKLYRVENDDVYSLPNTLLKMAKKRAIIDAVLAATRSSGLFTQDVIDEEDHRGAIDADAEEVQGGQGRGEAAAGKRGGQAQGGRGPAGQQQRAAQRQGQAARQGTPAPRPQPAEPPAPTAGEPISVRSEEVPIGPEPPTPAARPQVPQQGPQPPAQGQGRAPGAPRPPQPPATKLDAADRAAIDTLAATLGEPQTRIESMLRSVSTHDAAMSLIETLADRALDSVPDAEIMVRMVVGEDMLRKLLARRAATA